MWSWLFWSSGIILRSQLANFSQFCVGPSSGAYPPPTWIFSVQPPTYNTLNRYRYLAMDRSCDLDCFGQSCDVISGRRFLEKKNANALKTPSVVVPTFVYKIEFHIESDPAGRKQKARLHLHQALPGCCCITMIHLTEKNVFLTWWPWPLIYDLDLLTWPRYPSTSPPYQNSDPYVCPFTRESETHTQTDTQKHRSCQNYYTCRWRWV